MLCMPCMSHDHHEAIPLHGLALEIASRCGRDADTDTCLLGCGAVEHQLHMIICQYVALMPRTGASSTISCTHSHSIALGCDAPPRLAKASCSIHGAPVQ